MPLNVVFCADRFGLGQPGRLPASMNAMRVLSTSTDLEAAVADALVRGKTQNATNTRKSLKVASCTYVLSQFITILFMCQYVTLPKYFFGTWHILIKMVNTQLRCPTDSVAVINYIGAVRGLETFAAWNLECVERHNSLKHALVILMDLALTKCV